MLAKSAATLSCKGVLSLALYALLLSYPAAGFERTEDRLPCAHRSETKMALFGDLHVHTSYSFDSYISSQRNTPWDAYRYAKGEAITLSDADGEQTLQAQLQRPLDFTGITDHAEFLGPINICTTDSSAAGYWFPYCVLTRSNIYVLQLLAANYWASLGVLSETNDGDREASFVCQMSDCDGAHNATWQLIQQAAEEHYDRSSDCSFTTFVAYEYTDAPGGKNLHRNVVFRNENVTATAISTYDTGSRNVPELWSRLRAECLDDDVNCDVMAIPHNSNLSGGLMFPDPASEQEARDRLRLEPLFELIQHKAASECRFDRLLGRGLATEDELCDFEQAKSDNLTMLATVFGKVRTASAAPVGLDDFGRRNMVRNALKDGLALEQSSGINPFQMGFIGSTDTHSATPGGAEENNYVGHLGRRDAGYRNIQDHFFDNPGGLAVVWAEENSRDAIFDSMRERETYATSGTRPIVRFFAGDEIAVDACAQPDMIAQAYRDGVAMGGRLEQPASPRFLISASKDPGSPGNPGNDLQRIQIIKGWVDTGGTTHEHVFDVAGNANNGASVNPANCEPVGSGHEQLCRVWQDPQFNATESAFYYARVLENPSCRWSTLQCQAAGVNPFAADCQTQADARTAEQRDAGAIGDVYSKCCLDPAQEPFYSPVLQERAWTSPIWTSAAH
ncbi:DUF3604 domain-containing protein [Halieaceae bacterium IMCC14734]|uniref:DUF3604 domain-containing protein n=2 Tax=Candidatus Litorirhabdus singularis TaxID=2518993 RepID=A0ABT3TIF6_9GAMM|nr:DUF3604 domain-containing protein [Candidatus Litorirhabdus singularis]